MALILSDSKMSGQVIHNILILHHNMTRMIIEQSDHRKSQKTDFLDFLLVRQVTYSRNNCLTMFRPGQNIGNIGTVQ